MGIFLSCRHDQTFISLGDIVNAFIIERHDIKTATSDLLRATALQSELDILKTLEHKMNQVQILELCTQLRTNDYEKRLHEWVQLSKSKQE